MRQFTIAAATVAIAALISAAPASAERISGGPIKQNGQCWKSHSGGSEATFGNRARSLPAALELNRLLAVGPNAALRPSLSAPHSLWGLFLRPKAFASVASASPG